MINLLRLAFAIRTHEGWYPAGSEKAPEGSRSWRNHNPGNLRNSPFQNGQDGGYATFEDECTGFAALITDIYEKCVGDTSTGLNERSTLAELIEVYAPRADGNNTDAYIEDVVKLTGISADTPLSTFVE